LLPDLSPWAFTPTLAFAAKMVTVNMVVFWASVFVVFWLANRDRRFVEEGISARANRIPLVQPLPREESA